jgi:archaemetzincin
MCVSARRLSLVAGCLIVACMAAPARAEAPERTLTACLIPLGQQDAAMFESARRGVAQLFGFEVKVLPAMKMPRAAWYAPRKRWRADKLLDWLDDAAWPAGQGCTFVVGLTREDISVTTERAKDWGVMGLGQIGGRVAVSSSFRVHKKLTAPHTPARRFIKVVNHEIGHVLGVPHVSQRGCLMQDAEGTVLSLDTEDGLLCAPTVQWIEQHHGIKLPVLSRFDWSAVE